MSVTPSLRERVAGLVRHKLLRGVGILAGGTAVAQAASLVALPFLTRLYSPSDFSVLAIFASLLAVLSVAACLRFDVAIPLPERDEDAASLLAVALLCSASITACLAAAILMFGPRLISVEGLDSVYPYLWLLPIGVWLSSSYSALQYWATRKKRFARVAQTRVVQSVSGTGVQLLGGMSGSPIGLLLGQAVMSGAGVIALARDAKPWSRSVLPGLSWRGMFEVARAYDQFPKFSAVESLANNVGIQLPVILIATLAIGPEAGFLALATKVMAGPTSLIGGAVAQVFLSQAPQERREGTLDLFATGVLSGLVRAGVGPICFAAIVAAPMFALVFGSEWRRAGEIVSWMAPWLLLQFLSSPVSMVMHVMQQQKQMLALTMMGMAIRVGAIAAAWVLTRSHYVEFYAVSGAVFYGWCCYVFYRAAGMSLMQGVASFRTGMPWIAAWLALGLMVRTCLGSW